jgi:hypothetical protein
MLGLKRASGPNIAGNRPDTHPSLVIRRILLPVALLGIHVVEGPGGWQATGRRLRTAYREIASRSSQNVSEDPE